MAHEKTTVDVMNRLLHVSIWDRSGAEQYGAMTAAYYKRCTCAIVVYDATGKSTRDLSIAGMYC